MLKSKNYPDFSLNPNNIGIGDWVFARGNVGKVTDIHVNNGKMLQFWVNWDSSNVPSPELANNLQKVNKPMAISDSIQEVSGRIKLTLLTIDVNLQQRVEINNSVVDDYANAYSEGTELPPITVWREEGKREEGIGSSDNNQLFDSHHSELTTTTHCPLPTPRYYLVDGFHRVEAAKQAGITELPFIEKSGTYREALLFSLTVNATHGLRRSNADKRKAVMTLLEDSEWSQWSDREIARQCGVSHQFVNNLRKSICQPLTDTNLNNSDESICHSLTDTNLNNQRKVTRGGKTYIQDTTNIGKPKSSESLTPVEDNQIISEQLSEDIEVTDFQENNLIYNAPVEIDNGNTTAELIDSANIKPTKGKQKITNPLSIGDRVKVKDNHYFGGREGVVTQISSPSSLVVAFDNDQRELIRLQDLDLPSLSKPQKPQKKEILIKEGLNYKAGQGCKWYVEVEEEDYRLFQEYQRQVNAPTIRSCLVRAVEGQKQEKSPIKTDDLLINLSSKISYLNQEQRLLLAKQLIESDPDIFNKIIKEK